MTSIEFTIKENTIFNEFSLWVLVDNLHPCLIAKSSNKFLLKHQKIQEWIQNYLNHDNDDIKNCFYISKVSCINIVEILSIGKVIESIILD